MTKKEYQAKYINVSIAFPRYCTYQMYQAFKLTSVNNSKY